MRVAPKIVLSPDETLELEKLARGRRTSVRLAQRSAIVLLAAEGNENKRIASRLGISRETVGRWRRRYAESGMAGIEKDAPRPGRTPSISAAKVQEIVRKTTRSRPKGGTHWSSRTMATEVGVSATSVRRVWKRHGLKPHLVRTFKISNDPKFAEKLEDVVGLYMNPPEHALVLSVDEKSQIQALDRTQPGLPMKKGRCGTMTHDYKRNGTTTLFAALNTLDGTVISTCMPRHRHQEWLKFLKLIDKETPKDKELHLIADNYATHKAPAVKSWLAKHPRFHMHFTPTSASWLNMVERLFRDLTTKRLRRGVFLSVPDLIAAIEEYLESHHENPSPYIWTKSANDILAKVKRARQTLNKTASV
ncbi:MAG: IS630 family transposase [bacterium]|nr:IS630 family transposase [bacterium]